MPLRTREERPCKRSQTDPVKPMSTLARCQGVLDEYNRAPRLMLVFPTSGQTWQLRLTPAFTRHLAAEVSPLVRMLRSSRRLRHRPIGAARPGAALARR